MLGCRHGEHLPRVAGRRGYKTEPPQADQLADRGRPERQARRAVDRRQRPRLLRHHHACAGLRRRTGPATPRSSTVDARSPAALAEVGKAIGEIRAVIPRPATRRPLPPRPPELPLAVPRAAENRYPELWMDAPPRRRLPLLRTRDSDWARDSLVPQIANRLKGVERRRRGVQFLDLRDMLQGREVCSDRGSRCARRQPPSPTTSEWARFLDSGRRPGRAAGVASTPTPTPSAALGRCLTLLWASSPGRYACRNTPGQSYTAMTLAPSLGGACAPRPIGQLTPVPPRPQ